jgi:serine/threonine protein kinase/Flp pilus assembly protein TadD
MDEETIFITALEMESAHLRATYLDEACAGRTDLRRKVEELLVAHGRAGKFLDNVAAAWNAQLPIADRQTRTERPGTLVGQYKLLEEIGEGGMGLVFVAEQQQPVRRKVALKVIKPGMDTQQVVARLEGERQALALMDHPNIAKVLDGGETAGGRPYFVMELVNGVPITNYCDRNQVPIRQRLELFVDICQAVQHAHQKGIIHRDLKPSNVLVMSHDDKPVVKIIDFGVAKAIDQQLTDKTIYTQFAQLIGTPLYMSPEQAGQSGLDVDTRSDIFSLGVLLYELLTGTTPFDKERLRTVGYDEMRRIIREEEPPKPSTRIGTPGHAATTVSTMRQSDRKQLSRLIRGELDWIVMKALEKDRNRRYDTANGFVADVQRYLRDEPVLACPPSPWYRFGKFARRNKGVLVTALIVTAALLLATGVSTYFAFEAADRAHALRQGLDDLKAADRFLEIGRFSSDRLNWDDADAAFSAAIARCPDYPKPWQDRAGLYASLQLWDLAAPDLKRAFQLRDPDTNWYWLFEALLLLDEGDAEGYSALCVRMRQRFSGALERDDTAFLVRTLMQLPDPQADRTALADLARRIAEAQPEVGWYWYVAGLAEFRAGRYELAVETLQRSYKTDPRKGQRELNLPVLALTYHRLGQPQQANKALADAEAAIEHWTQAMYGKGGGKGWEIHQDAQPTLSLSRHDWLEIRARYREAYRAIHGTDRPHDYRLDVIRARSLAGLRHRQEADAVYSVALQKRPDDAQVRYESYRNRACFAAEQERWDDAVVEFGRVLALRPDDVRLWSYQVTAELAAGHIDAYRRDCRVMWKRFGRTTDPYVAHHFVTTCTLRGDSLSDMSELIPPARVAARFHHGNVRMLGAALYRAGRYDEALDCLDQAARQLRRNPTGWCFTSMCQKRLGRTAEAQDSLKQAMEWIEQADQQNPEDLIGPRPHWGGADDRFEFRLMVREAKRVVQGD